MVLRHSLLLAVVLALGQVGVAVAGDSLRVMAAQLSNQSVHVARDTAILVRFDRAVDPVSLGAGMVVTGRFGGVGDGTLQVSGRNARFLPDNDLAAGDWVTVRILPGVQALEGGALQTGYQWNFWTASEPAAMNYTQVQLLHPGSVPYGAYGGDLDGDGDLDLTLIDETADEVRILHSQ